MHAADWISATSGFIAAIGLFFTGYQVLLLNRQAGHDRRVVLEGVAATWRPIEAPSRAERPDGRSEWLYELRIVNPGRLPIDDVQVHWFFPCDVNRLRHDGVTDDATREFVLSAPVLVGGADRVWKRRLLIAFAEKPTLTEVYAEIEFNDMDGERHTTRWPRRARLPLGQRAEPDTAA